MAKKIDRAELSAPSAPKAVEGADDLATLAPDGEITIAGEKIVVREYRFMEGLRLKVTARPFFDGLYDMLGGDQPRQDDKPPSFEDVLALVVENEQIVAGMVATSVDRPLDWLEGLSEADGDALMLTWWSVNSGFFFRSVFRRAMQTRLAAKPHDGHASTTP